MPQFKYRVSGTYVIASQGTGTGEAGYQVSVTPRESWSGSLVFKQNTAPPGSTAVYTDVAYQNATTAAEVAAGTAITGTAAIIISPTVGDLVVVVTMTAGEIIINVNPATVGVTNRELMNAFLAAGYDTAGQDTTESMLSVAVADLLGATTTAAVLGAVADGTDQTATIIAALTALPADTRRVYTLPPGMVVDYTALVAFLYTRPGILFIDHSARSSYNTGGFTSKVVGIVSGDVTADDSSWSIQSGHHAVLDFSNFGSSEDSPGVPTSSGAQRAMSIFYEVGEYTTAPNPGNRGYKTAAHLLWSKDGANPWWAWQLRKYAPWVAIAADFERWASGVAATSGVTYVQGASNGNFYIAASSGTTGNTAPVHTSGTVSDGGVDWTFVESLDTGLFGIDEFGRLRLNNGVTATALASFKQNAVDPTGVAVVEIIPTGIDREAALILKGTNGSGTAVSSPYLQAYGDGSVVLRRAADDGSLFRASDAGEFAVNGFRLGDTLFVAADADTTPTVAGVGTLYLSNTGATSITTLDDGSNNQVVRLIATNGNTTLVHSAGFALAGAANRVLTTSSSLTMQKLHSSISSGWVEVSRSIV